MAISATASRASPDPDIAAINPALMSSTRADPILVHHPAPGDV
ncbi:hypothetical protein [Microbacterium sp. CIAB417]|nr:hypothetical protein [Microbacterium sp. CIAB417]